MNRVHRTVLIVFYAMLVGAFLAIVIIVTDGAFHEPAAPKEAAPQDRQPAPPPTPQ